MLVRLDDTLHVNPDDVVSVRSDYERRLLIVTMRGGEVHRVAPQYGESVFDAETRTIAALTPPSRGQG